MKHKKPLKDGSIVKEALVKRVRNYLKIFKIKQRLCLLLENFSYLADNLKHDIMKLTCIPVQFDKSTDMTDTTQSGIFLRMIFSDMSVEEEFLTMISLKRKTRGEDIYDVFFNLITNSKLPICKLVCSTTEGTIAKTVNKTGFVALCRGKFPFISFLTNALNFNTICVQKFYT